MLESNSNTGLSSIVLSPYRNYIGMSNISQLRRQSNYYEFARDVADTYMMGKQNGSIRRKADLASRFGYSKGTIDSILQDAKDLGKKVSPYKMNAARTEQLLNDYNTQTEKSVKEIAKEYNISTSYLYKLLKKQKDAGKNVNYRGRKNTAEMNSQNLETTLEADYSSSSASSIVKIGQRHELSRYTIPLYNRLKRAGKAITRALVTTGVVAIVVGGVIGGYMSGNSGKAKLAREIEVLKEQYNASLVEQTNERETLKQQYNQSVKEKEQLLIETNKTNQLLQERIKELIDVDKQSPAEPKSVIVGAPVNTDNPPLVGEDYQTEEGKTSLSAGASVVKETKVVGNNANECNICEKLGIQKQQYLKDKPWDYPKRLHQRSKELSAKGDVFGDYTTRAGWILAVGNDALEGPVRVVTATGGGVIAETQKKGYNLSRFLEGVAGGIAGTIEGVVLQNGNNFDRGYKEAQGITSKTLRFAYGSAGGIAGTAEGILLQNGNNFDKGWKEADKSMDNALLFLFNKNNNFDKGWKAGDHFGAYLMDGFYGGITKTEFDGRLLQLDLKGALKIPYCMEDTELGGHAKLGQIVWWDFVFPWVVDDIFGYDGHHHHGGGGGILREGGEIGREGGVLK